MAYRQKRQDRKEKRDKRDRKKGRKGPGVPTCKICGFSILGGRGCHLDEFLEAFVVDVRGSPLGHLVSRKTGVLARLNRGTKTKDEDEGRRLGLTYFLPNFMVSRVKGSLLQDSELPIDSSCTFCKCEFNRRRRRRRRTNIKKVPRKTDEDVPGAWTPFASGKRNTRR